MFKRSITRRWFYSVLFSFLCLMESQLSLGAPIVPNEQIQSEVIVRLATDLNTFIGPNSPYEWRATENNDGSFSMIMNPKTNTYSVKPLEITIEFDNDERSETFRLPIKIFSNAMATYSGKYLNLKSQWANIIEELHKKTLPIQTETRLGNIRTDGQIKPDTLNNLLAPIFFKATQFIREAINDYYVFENQQIGFKKDSDLSDSVYRWQSVGMYGGIALGVALLGISVFQSFHFNSVTEPLFHSLQLGLRNLSPNLPTMAFPVGLLILTLEGINAAIGIANTGLGVEGIDFFSKLRLFIHDWTEDYKDKREYRTMEKKLAKIKAEEAKGNPKIFKIHDVKIKLVETISSHREESEDAIKELILEAVQSDTLTKAEQLRLAEIKIEGYVSAQLEQLKSGGPHSLPLTLSSQRGFTMNRGLHAILTGIQAFQKHGGPTADVTFEISVSGNPWDYVYFYELLEQTEKVGFINYGNALDERLPERFKIYQCIKALAH